MTAELHRTQPPAAAVSWTAVVLTVIDLLVAPVGILLRRRDRMWPAVAAAMWMTVSYSFVVTSLTEVGENMRFRFELGTLPPLLAVAGIGLVAREIRYRRGRAG